MTGRRQMQHLVSYLLFAAVGVTLPLVGWEIAPFHPLLALWRAILLARARGTAPALNDLLAGHVDLFFDNIASSLAQHQSGTIRILAVCSMLVTSTATLIPVGEERGK